MSGGNQQKVIIAKWLSINPQVLIIDDPTRGIDVGSKAEIYKLINQFTRNDNSILMTSTELPELIAMSDRMFVFCGGKVVAELSSNDDITEAKVMSLMTGAST